jgi:uncharacterized protein YndB with AHSA1/START domain
MDTATATEDTTSLDIRRLYPQSVATVYTAWSDPEKMKQWMGASDDPGDSEITMDVRVGGRYRFVMRAPDGEVHRVGGVFKEIVPGSKLVYTWAWESTPERESLVTVEFKPSGQGTEVRLLHQRFFDSAARDRHALGWNGCLERLGRYLSR